MPEIEQWAYFRVKVTVALVILMSIIHLCPMEKRPEEAPVGRHENLMQVGFQRLDPSSPSSYTTTTNTTTTNRTATGR